jgi:hypothetical protein
VSAFRDYVAGSVSVPRPKRGMASSVTPDASFEEWATAAYLRHPRKRNKSSAWLALREVYGDSAKRALFDENHQRYCALDDWKKANARYCPKLANFIRDDEYMSAPTSDDEGKGYVGVEVPELGLYDDPKPPPCKHCKGTTWVLSERDGVSAASRCECISAKVGDVLKPPDIAPQREIQTSTSQQNSPRSIKECLREWGLTESLKKAS